MSRELYPELFRVLVKFQIDKEHTGGIAYRLVRFYQVTKFFRQGVREMGRTDGRLCDPEMRNKGHPVKRYMLLKMKPGSNFLLEVANEKTVRFNSGTPESFHLTAAGEKNKGVYIFMVKCLHKLPEILVHPGN